MNTTLASNSSAASQAERAGLPHNACGTHQAIPPSLGRPRLHLPVSARTVFLDVNGVRAFRGISADKVRELIDTGELLWVFNVGRVIGCPIIKNLRFWLPGIAEPAATAKMDLEQVISQIIPAGRQTFSGSELCQWFLVSRPTVSHHRLELRGTIQNKTIHVEREPLMDYLRRRWIGGGQ